jgi:hypothetical protein
VFRVLVLLMAGVLLAKATIALAIPERFYAERRRQFASPIPPGRVFFGPVLIAGLAATAWYAAMAHYEPWGWVVTASLTAFACLSLLALVRWDTHRQTMKRLVADPKVWRTDCALLAAGVLLMGLGFLVYE